MLYEAHTSGSDGGLPSGVPTLHEPFTPEDLLGAIESLIAWEADGPGPVPPLAQDQEVARSSATTFAALGALLISSSGFHLEIPRSTAVPVT